VGQDKPADIMPFFYYNKRGVAEPDSAFSLVPVGQSVGKFLSANLLGLQFQPYEHFLGKDN
jgi:hypothetical protein